MAARRREPPPADLTGGDPAANALAMAQREAEFKFASPLEPRRWGSHQTALTPEVEHAILEALRAGHFRADAATNGGVDPRTLRTWVRKGRTGDLEYVEFARRVLAAEFECKDRLLSKVKGGDERSAAWLLEQRFRSQFATRMKIIHATVRTEREQALDVISMLLDEFEHAQREGRIMVDLFETFAERFDARLSQTQEATEEALESEFEDG